MEAFSTLLGGWLSGFGVPPVLGAFVLGAMLAYFCLPPRRGRATSEDPPLIGRAGASRAIEYEDRDIVVPAEVLATIAQGDRIGAIKTLRDACGLQLVDAKRVVDALAR